LQSTRGSRAWPPQSRNVLHPSAPIQSRSLAQPRSIEVLKQQPSQSASLPRQFPPAASRISPPQHCLHHFLFSRITSADCPTPRLSRCLASLRSQSISVARSAHSIPLLYLQTEHRRAAASLLRNKTAAPNAPASSSEWTR